MFSVRLATIPNISEISNLSNLSNSLPSSLNNSKIMLSPSQSTAGTKNITNFNGHKEESSSDSESDSETSSQETDDCIENKTNKKNNNRTESDVSDTDDTQESEDEEEDDENNGGYELDDFQIIKTIGTGTFGRVCLCREKEDKKYYAIKILAMADIIRLKQTEHIKNEKNILSEINHPFIVNLIWSSRDDCCIYMLFDYVSGGELFSYLRNAGRFSNSTANFYSCEITVALEYLHALSIVYRDLKPENLLIATDGHLKITDFGFAKKLTDRTWTLCGTPEYLAPEIIQSKGHNKAVDWWALGVLIYEMLVGYPPFYDDNPFGIYEKILSGKIEWPKLMDSIAKDLVKKLLVMDRTKRLGNMKNGAEDVKKHRWFKNLDWDDVLNKKLKPPIMPKISYDGDTSNFDEYPETDWKSHRAMDKIELKLFEDF